MIELEPSAVQFTGTAAIICHELEHNRRYTITDITPSLIGAALACFMDVVERDAAIENSTFFVGDTVIRVIA